jgi:polyphosphate kinase
MNALVDAQIIEALYDASRTPAWKIDSSSAASAACGPAWGLSERIRVISIIGRFLEHSRIWMFGNAGAPEYYFGSADWMPRNLDRRVEVVTPVENPLFQKRIQSVLEVCLSDNRQAWDLHADGAYVQRQPEPGRGERATHRMLLRDSWGGSRESGAFTFDVSALQRSKEPGRPPSSTAEFRAFTGG